MTDVTCSLTSRLWALDIHVSVKLITHKLLALACESVSACESVCLQEQLLLDLHNEKDKVSTLQRQLSTGLCTACIIHHNTLSMIGHIETYLIPV